MISHCHSCDHAMDDRVDVRYTLDGRTFCSGPCLDKYRFAKGFW